MAGPEGEVTSTGSMQCNAQHQQHMSIRCSSNRDVSDARLLYSFFFLFSFSAGKSGATAVTGVRGVCASVLVEDEGEGS